MAGDYFSQCDPRFGPNALAYFHHVRDHDLTLTHALTNPQVDRSKSASRARRPVHRPRRRPRDRRRDHRPRRPNARHAADLRRDPDLPVDGAERRRRPQAVRARVRDPERHARALVPVPRTARHRSQPRRSPARLTVRRDGRDGVLRRRARAVGARVPDERRRARQPGVREDGCRAPHGAPGRQPQDLQDRGVPRGDAVGRRHDRHGRVPARAGDDRRGRDRARDHEGASRSLRSPAPRSTSTA